MYLSLVVGASYLQHIVGRTVGAERPTIRMSSLHEDSIILGNTGHVEQLAAQLLPLLGAFPPPYAQLQSGVKGSLLQPK